MYLHPTDVCFLFILWLFTCLFPVQGSFLASAFLTFIFTPLSLSHLSVHPCFHHYLCRSFCFGHVSRLQRFEGFRNEKTMPQSLEPSCSGATEEGPVTTNHLRLVPGTHVAVWPAKSKCYHPSTLSRQFSQTELLETSTAVELSMYFNWTAFKTKTASVLAPFHI